MFCNKCGKENLERSAFCVECGAQLTAPQAPVAPAAPAPAPNKKRTGLIVGIAAAVVAIIAIVIGILFARDVISGKNDSADKMNEPKTEDSVSVNAGITDKDKEKEDEKINYIGTWTAEVDFGSMINDMYADDPDIGSYVKFSKIILKLDFTFNEDGTYSIVGDKDSVIETSKALKADFKSGMLDYIADNGMTLEQFEAASGMSLDKIVDESFGENFTNEFANELEAKGKYKFEDGKLYTTDDLTEELVDTEYETFEIINNKELKFTGCVGENAAEMSSIYPYIMIKK